MSSASTWARPAAGPSPPTARAAEGAGAPGLADPGGVELALDAVRRVVAAATSDTPAAVCVGAAGAMAAPEEADRLARLLAEALPGCRVAVTSDAVIAHAGALGGAPGAVLAVGTGAVALGVDASGRRTTVDGWGPWLGDDGGGAWIGREALRAVLRARESPRTGDDAHRAPPRSGTATSPGCRAPCRRRAAPARSCPTCSPPRPPATRSRATSSSAPADAWCELGLAAVRAAGEPTLVVVGGLADVPLLRELLRQRLPADVVVRDPLGVPVDGAAAARRRSRPAAPVRRATRAHGHAMTSTCSPPSRPAPTSPTSTPASPGDLVDVLLAAEAARAGGPGRARARGWRRPSSGPPRPSPPVGGWSTSAPARPAGWRPSTPRSARPPSASRPTGWSRSWPAATWPRARPSRAPRTTPRPGREDLAGGRRRPEGRRGRHHRVGAYAVRAGGARGGPRRRGDAPSRSSTTRAARLHRWPRWRSSCSPVPRCSPGSTRLKAGTAQKVVLNVISTGAMVTAGRTYGAWMVDVVAANEKLRRRARRILREATGVDDATALAALEDAGWRTKTALVALLADVPTPTSPASGSSATAAGCVAPWSRARDRRRRWPPAPRPTASTSALSTCTSAPTAWSRCRSWTPGPRTGPRGCGTGCSPCCRPPR